MFFKKLIKQKLYSRVLAKHNYVSRSAVVLLSMIGSSFFVHNGQKFKRISVVRSHVGMKFGEFCFTRRLPKHKKKKKKK